MVDMQFQLKRHEDGATLWTGFSWLRGGLVADRCERLELMKQEKL